MRLASLNGVHWLAHLLARQLAACSLQLEAAAAGSSSCLSFVVCGGGERDKLYVEVKVSALLGSACEPRSRAMGVANPTSWQNANATKFAEFVQVGHLVRSTCHQN